MTLAPWPVHPLGEVAQCDLGRMLDKTKNEGDPHPYLANAAVRWGAFDLSHLGSIRVKAEDLDRYSVRAGDLVLCEGGEPGRCAVWDDSASVVFQKALHRIRPAADLDVRFLQMYFRYAAQCSWFQAFFTGTTIKHLPKQQLVRVPVPVPPLDEQRAIVAAIEDASARIDAIEGELDPIHRSRELFRVAVLRDAMRGALLSSDRVASAEGPGAGEPGLPSGWVWRELSSVSENLDRKRVPVNAKERAERPGDVPYYGATGRVGWIDEPLFDEDLVLLGEDGVSFLDPKVAKAYRVSGKSWVNNHAHVLRPNRSVVTDAFLCFALNQIDYSGRVSGTTRLKLTQKDMNRLRLPIPPLDEQIAIVTEIEDALGRVEELDRLASEVEASLEALRASILYRAFTGDLPGTPASEKESVAA